MRTEQLLFAGLFVALGLGTASPASAASFSIPISYSYSSYSSPTDPTHPDFYTYSTTFTLPVGYTNASLNITAMHFDDRGVVQLNGATATSSGIANGGPLTGQMILTSGGSPVPFTFQYDYFATIFAPITTGFQTGTNTLDIIVNDTSGGLNFSDGRLSGGYYWFFNGCYDGSGCTTSYSYGGNTYYRGFPNPPTSGLFEATVTYDLADVVGETPLPAALPLFATGLAGLGFVGRRRRKQTA